MKSNLKVCFKLLISIYIYYWTLKAIELSGYKIYDLVTIFKS